MASYRKSAAVRRAVRILTLVFVRCHVSRQLYDGFRHLKSFGRWSWTGMTYEEVWDKYERKIRKSKSHEGVRQLLDIHHVEVRWGAVCQPRISCFSCQQLF